MDEQLPTNPMKWLSDCCDAPPIGDVYKWIDVKSNEERASGYCADCKEPCDFHKDKEGE